MLLDNSNPNKKRRVNDTTAKPPSTSYRLSVSIQSQLKQSLKRCLNQRRRGEQEAFANRLGVLSGLLVAGASVGLYAIGGWTVLEQQSYNLLHHTRRELSQAPKWDDRIAVIALDEASIDQVGPHPCPRDRYIDLLQALAAAQPATVAFDVIFSETTQQDPQFANAVIDSANIVFSVGTDGQSRYIDIADSLAEPTRGFFLKGDNAIVPDDDGISRQLWLQGSEGDPAFAIAALQVYTDVMSHTAQAQPAESNRSAHKPHRYSHSIQTAQPSDAIPNKTHSSSAHPKTHYPSAFGATDAESSPPSAATGSGISVTEKTASERASSEPTVSEKPPLSRRPFFNIGLPSMFEQVTQTVPTMAELLPTDDTVWLNWPGEIANPRQVRPGDLNVYSYMDVVSGKVDTSLFRNKIVLVGATSATYDPIRTPFHKAAPTSGVFFHAAAIDNLLNQSFLRRLTRSKELLLLVGVALCGSYFLRRLEASWRLTGVLSFPLLWGAMAYSGFLMGWWLPIAAPIGTLFLSALAVQLHEQQEKQQLMALFSMNVSPGTAQLIWRNKGEILDQGELAAQNLTATVLFMDIRGFTSIAETLPSHKLLPWLNQYFETMTDCIMENGGMVDKYIGDAIMAVFGAPVPRTTPEEIKADAVAALKSAMEMHSRLVLLNHKLKEQKLPLIKFGIGVHTGPLVAGTVGNRHRLNYSLFGDTVNVAARIESMTKTLPESAPFNLLISDNTYRHAHEQFPLVRVRTAPIRGRTGQIDVYTLAQLPMAVPRRTAASRERDNVTPIGLGVVSAEVQRRRDIS